MEKQKKKIDGKRSHKRYILKFNMLSSDE